MKNDAAKRCIDRITAADYSFTDPLSGVSTRQLLALTYTAIHDRSKCSASLEDAKSLLVEGYYETQRGYNLDDEGVDKGDLTDGFICTSGTFNKIIEKLDRIHRDVEIYYITKEGANLKFPKLVEEHALDYLRRIASPKTDEDYRQCQAILASMRQENSLEPIWDKIKARVERDLWDEFKEAYGDNPKNSDFLYLIDEGWKYLEAPKELPAIKAPLRLTVPLPGYVQLNRSDEGMLAYLARSWFYENRHSSREAQHHFDKQYGIVPFIR